MAIWFSPTATHNVADGHATSSARIGSRRSVQASGPPPGSVETKALPSPSTATQNVGVGQDAARSWYHGP